MSGIAIIGLWHQGVVAAGCLADLGFTAVAADRDAEVVARLNEGHAPLFEPGLDALLEKGLASGRLSFTHDVAAAVRDMPFVFLMFDTPVDEADRSDPAEVFAAFRAAAPAIRPDATVWVTAQLAVGTCEALLEEGRRAGLAPAVRIAYSPENLRLGQAIERFLAPPLPVIGTDDDAAFDRLAELLAPLSTDWQRVSLRTAEMLKHALNGFLAVSICFANEIGNLCDEVGADGRRIGEMLRLEPRIGAKAMLLPGLGFSGGTLARDMQTLRHIGDERGLDTPLLDGAWAANAAQNRLVLRKLKGVRDSLVGIRVAVLGLTYKPDTSTLRRSAALEVIADLVREGAHVGAHDPLADRAELALYKGFTVHEDPYAAAEGAEALVLMTPWREYRDLDFARLHRVMATPAVIDTAGLWDAQSLQAMGFAYDDIGRGRRLTAGR